MSIAIAARLVLVRFHYWSVLLQHFEKCQLSFTAPHVTKISVGLCLAGWGMWAEQAGRKADNSANFPQLFKYITLDLYAGLSVLIYFR